MPSQIEHAEHFRTLHHGDTPLLLANVWDPLSAAIVADAGLPAVATASAAVALSRGCDDGEQIGLEELVQTVERITEVVSLPISVDFERGYGDTTVDVAASASQLIVAGAVGVNIEDSLPDGSVRDADDQCARIAAVKLSGADAGVPVFVNARTDVFMLGGNETDAIRRLRAYASAGADGIYPIMCTDPATLGRIHTAVELPINVLLTPELPPLADLLAVGVRRISMGPGLLSITAGAARDAVARLASGDLSLDNLPRMSTADIRRTLGIPR